MKNLIMLMALLWSTSSLATMGGEAGGGAKDCKADFNLQMSRLIKEISKYEIKLPSGVSIQKLHDLINPDMNPIINLVVKDQPIKGCKMAENPMACSNTSKNIIQINCNEENGWLVGRLELERKKDVLHEYLYWVVGNRDHDYFLSNAIISELKDKKFSENEIILQNRILHALHKWNQREIIRFVWKYTEKLGDLSHRQLYNYEKQRFDEFRDIADGFRGLNIQNQLDNILPGSYHFVTPRLSKTSFSTTSFSDFSFMTEFLSFEMSEYSISTLSMFKRIREDATETISATGMKKLDEIIKKMEEVNSYLDASYSKVENGKTVNYKASKTVFSDYLEDMELYFRKQILAYSCESPVIYKIQNEVIAHHPSLAKKRNFEEAAKAEWPNVANYRNYIELNNQVRKKAYSVLREWQDLVEAEGLDDKKFVMWGGDNLASGIDYLLQILQSYFFETEYHFKQDYEVIREVEIYEDNLCY